MQQSRRAVSATRDGAIDVEPFEVFYRREYTRMVAIARALLRSGASAEDLAQESFLAAHRQWDRIAGYDDPGAWVRRVLINRATSFHRRRGVEWRALNQLGGHAREDTLPELSPQAVEVWTKSADSPSDRPRPRFSTMSISFRWKRWPRSWGSVRAP